jgi:hypothetical protein
MTSAIRMGDTTVYSRTSCISSSTIRSSAIRIRSDFDSTSSGPLTATPQDVPPAASAARRLPPQARALVRTGRRLCLPPTYPRLPECRPFRSARAAPDQAGAARSARAQAVAAGGGPALAVAAVGPRPRPPSGCGRTQPAGVIQWQISYLTS